VSTDLEQQRASTTFIAIGSSASVPLIDGGEHDSGCRGVCFKGLILFAICSRIPTRIRGEIWRARKIPRPATHTQ
jgi:hypothetical protein